MDEGRFLVFHLLGVFAALAEIRVLVYGAGNEAGYRSRPERVRTKDVRERSCEAGGGLSGTEVEFADVVAVVEAEGSADGIDGDAFGHAADIFIKGA